MTIRIKITIWNQKTTNTHSKVNNKQSKNFLVILVGDTNVGKSSLLSK
jgi:GTP-binding protein EngB required for normal cell division